MFVRSYKSVFLFCRTLSQWQFRSCQGRLCTSPHRVHHFCAVSQKSCMGFCFLSFWPPKMWAPSTATLHPANYLPGPPASALVCLYMVYFGCAIAFYPNVWQPERKYFWSKSDSSRKTDNSVIIGYFLNKLTVIYFLTLLRLKSVLSILCEK